MLRYSFYCGARHLWLPLFGAVFLLLGVMGNLLPFLLISIGQKDISSGMTGLLMAFMPLATMILAHYFVLGESLNRFKIFVRYYWRGYCVLAVVSKR